MAPSLFKQDAPDESRDASARAAAPDSIDRVRRRRADEPASLSVIGPGMEIVGEVRGRGDAQIEGRIEGRLDFDGQVRVSGCGRVEGEIVVGRLVVAGEVEGSITAYDSTELLEGCRVDADIQSPKVVLASGGVLNGRIDMSKPARQDAKDGTSAAGKAGPVASGKSDESTGRASDPSPAGNNGSLEARPKAVGGAA